MQVHNLKVEIQGFKANLHNTTRFIQEPKQLKETMKEMYKKYLRDYDQVTVGDSVDVTSSHCSPHKLNMLQRLTLTQSMPDNENTWRKAWHL